MPPEPFEWRNGAIDRERSEDSGGPAAPNDGTQECLGALGDRLAAAEQNLANADCAGEQE
jgi:hypothetical protein